MHSVEHLSELGWELLGERSHERIGNNIHMALHRFPGLGFLLILPLVQLLNLLEVVATVRQK
jgi:hypothetical protein